MEQFRQFLGARHCIVGLLSGHGSTLTYLAEDTSRNCKVMLKLSKLADLASEMHMRTETNILSTISHPNIVRLLSHGRLPDGRSYIITDYIPGKSLEEIIFTDKLNANQS